MNTQHKRHAFTLIELLVVIAIISLLAAILFPVFTTAREKGRLAQCTSNLKQFGLGITQYCQDYDEGMPIGITGKDEVGPQAAALAGVPEFDVAVEIQPYVKSSQLFQCPDDNGFIKIAGKANTVTANVNGTSQSITVDGMPVWGGYGTSYKFTKENFTMLPPTYANNGSTTTAPLYNSSCAGALASCQTYTEWTLTPAQIKNNAADLSAAIAGTQAPDAVAPPCPLPLGIFARPSETRMMRDFVGPMDLPITKSGPNDMHPAADMTLFVDGHVKNVVSEWQYIQYCDGWDASPARLVLKPTSDDLIAGDGSCNTGGVEREQD